MPRPWSARNHCEVRVTAITSQELMLKLPCAAYMTDAQGYLTFYNNAALVLWGREPVLGEDRWCGTLRGFNLQGNPVPLSQCPMAIAGQRRHYQKLECRGGKNKRIY